MRLLEPQAFLTGPAATAAVAAGLACPLAGGPIAFAMARLIETNRLVGIGDVPAEYQAALQDVSRPRPAWAGLAGMPPFVMGVLNVTPDSFSDGGRFTGPKEAIAAGLVMREAGADVIDVGGESTRPGSALTSPDEERARILPVIAGLAAHGVLVSADTRNAATMAAALAVGARIINDVSGLSHDPEAAAVVAAHGCAVVLMHMRGTPETMNRRARYDDVTVETVRELRLRLDAAERAGIDPEQIAVDPGIGFAKNAGQNIELLARLATLLNLGRPIVLGVSRKAFIGRLSAVASPEQRDAGSLAAGLAGALHGATVLRVHNVVETVRALRVWRALVSASLRDDGVPPAFSLADR